MLYQSPSTGGLTSTATTVMLRLSEALDPEAGEIRMGPTDYDHFVLKDLHIPYYDNQTGTRGPPLAQSPSQRTRALHEITTFHRKTLSEGVRRCSSATS